MVFELETADSPYYYENTRSWDLTLHVLIEDGSEGKNANKYVIKRNLKVES